MTPDMFFMPLIADAFRKSDPKKGLKQAFEEIERLGRNPEYQRGFKQFQVFMAEAYRYIDDPLTTDNELNTLFEDLKLQIISGVLEDRQEEQACLDLIKSHPGLEKRFEKQCKEMEKAGKRDRPLRLIIDKDGESFETINIDQLSPTQSLKSIAPGRYGFRLETGRLIGEEELSRNELLWEYAYPRQDLRLAADTEDTLSIPTRTIKFLNGEISINVFPGIDSGRLELEIECLSE
jgi:hypothetical protein